MKAKHPKIVLATLNFVHHIQRSGLEGIRKYTPEITYNNTRVKSKNGKKLPDGIEIRFGEYRPTEAVREQLKNYGFRFSEKQKMWYAWDSAKTRTFIEVFTKEEVEVDDTKYEKLHFWVVVKNASEYDKLFNRTEFYVKNVPLEFFQSKAHLQSKYNPKQMIAGGRLSFKKFFNKVIGESDEEVTQTEETDELPSESSLPSQSNEIAEKLQALAAGMEKQIKGKLDSPTGRQRPTPRRVRMAASMREEGYKLKETQKILYALAKVHRNGKIDYYSFLKNIRAKSEVELLNRFDFKLSRNTMQVIYDDNAKTFQKLGINTIDDWNEAILKRNELPNNSSSPDELEQKIKRLEDKLVGSKIAGFFPTPQTLAERVVSLADIQPKDSILEPSAGKGDLLDQVKRSYPTYNLRLSAVEINNSLRELLTHKGYSLVGTDFLQHQGSYDKIIMNPPFENGQDIDHVLHAFSLLKQGGKLVAIVSEGPFFRQSKKDVAFRKMLEDHNAGISQPIKDAFKNSFNSTGVTVRIIEIEKEGAEINANFSQVNENLQLQAEAELEILRLKVELARKKKQGLSGIDKQKQQELIYRAWEIENRWQVLNFK